VKAIDCDIICISETHLVENQTIEVNGYKWYGHNRQGLHVRAPKGSGGVGILVRDCLFMNFDVNIVDKDHGGVLGVQFHHKKSDLTIILYVCYLLPENSHWGRDSVSFFSHLLSQTYIHSEADYLMFCGDFNSRIGDMNDVIGILDSLPVREGIDKTVNQHGKSMIDFLHEAKCCVLNGRLNIGCDEYTTSGVR
jgi:exonuclease III